MISFPIYNILLEYAIVYLNRTELTRWPGVTVTVAIAAVVKVVVYFYKKLSRINQVHFGQEHEHANKSTLELRDLLLLIPRNYRMIIRFIEKHINSYAYRWSF